MVAQLTAHYNLTPSETVQRHKFHSRIRKEGKSVPIFVLELRSIATSCNFGDNLEQMLQDRLICRINNDTIQNRLLAVAKLDFKKAMELAQSMKEAAKCAKELKLTSTTREELHKVHVNATDKLEGVICHRCGRKGHKAPSCRFKNSKCHKCGKIGHIQRACCSKPTLAPSSRQVHCVAVTDGTKEQADEYYFFNVESTNSVPPVKVEVVIDGKPVNMEIDTGVGPSIVSEATYKELWPDRPLLPSTVKLRTY